MKSVNKNTQRFGDVRLVVVGGCAKRMTDFASVLVEKMRSCDVEVNDDALVDLSEERGRYCLFKVNHVLVANHGMGAGSVSILIHELLKLLAGLISADRNYFLLAIFLLLVYSIDA